MKRAGVVLSILSMALLHLVCCGMPLIIALGGSIGLYFSLKEYTGWALLFHMFSVGVMLYFLYKPGMSNIKKVKVQRIVFWVFTLLTLGTYVFTHSNLFKSEEEILQQQYFERIFKPKNK